jgi:SsrA-binding protein
VFVERLYRQVLLIWRHSGKRCGGPAPVVFEAAEPEAGATSGEAELIDPLQGLLGGEVVRNGEAGLAGAYAKVDNGQLFLQQVSIPPYEFGNRFNHDTLRNRRLLVHRKEIRRLQALQEQKGMALIPLRLYLNNRGIVKVELAVCRGKAQEDRRETIRSREADRDAARAIASHGRGRD